MNVTALFATLVTIAVISLVYFISKRLTGDGEVSIIIALLSVPVLCVAILIYVFWYAVFAL
jgi:lipopolysaccharide export LptBFGC system permease protein LptF